MGKGLAHLTDIDKIKQLNQTHIKDKMDVCNRATIDNAAKEHRIIKPAASVKGSVATLPMEAVGIKGGPRFPAPTVPDVSGDLNFLMSTWATQEYQKNVSGESEDKQKDPDYIPSSIYSSSEFSDRDLWDDINIRRKKAKKQ